VQPPLVEPNCPQVSLLVFFNLIRAISMTTSCFF
jgi:hypothetical protein